LLISADLENILSFLCPESNQKSEILSQLLKKSNVILSDYAVNIFFNTQNFLLADFRYFAKYF
jgi:hypothetical protein